MARDDGWLAEHMLILKLTSPKGVTKYLAAAFPSACGKTNLAMLVPTIPGWKVETVGDDICWMKFGDDGRLYAINPEAGFFGVAPGTGMDTNPNAMMTLEENCIFTNTALTADGDVWWEGMTPDKPPRPHRLEGQPLDAGVRHARGAPERALHRAGVAVPVDRARVGGPEGRADLGDPVRRPPRLGRAARQRGARRGQHGVFLGSIMASETTAAAAGAVGNLRRDPFAMLPFCGYNMADYFAHWLDDRAGHRSRQAAEPLHGQLVPQGRRRQVAVARVRREQPRAQVGLRAGRRRGRGREDADRPAADARRDRHERPRRHRGRHGAAARRSTSTAGARRSRSSRSTTRSSASTSRRELRAELDELEKRLAG